MRYFNNVKKAYFGVFSVLDIVEKIFSKQKKMYTII